MCIQDVVQIVVGVGTFLSALAALATVCLIRRQIRATYIPSLCVLNGQIHLYERGHLLFLSDKEDFASTSSNDPPLQLPIANLGLGAAKELQCSWSIDLDTYMREITSLDTQHTWRFTRRESEFEIRENDFPSTYRLAQLRSTIPFVVPASLSTHPMLLAFPSLILDLVTIFFRANIFRPIASAANEPSQRTLSAPSISLSITYRDIGGEERRIALPITFQLFLFSNTQGPLGENTYGIGSVGTH